MSHDDLDFDKASIAMSMQTLSISSTVSTLSGWTSVPSSSQKISLTSFDLCSYIHMIPDVDLSPIKELVVRKEEGGYRHEFLLILLAKPRGEEFWVHLERRGPPGLTLGAPRTLHLVA